MVAIISTIRFGSSVVDRKLFSMTPFFARAPVFDELLAEDFWVGGT